MTHERTIADRTESQRMESLAAELDRVIEKRSRSEQRAETEAQWDVTARKEKAREQAYLKHLWISYYQHQARAPRQIEVASLRRGSKLVDQKEN